MSASGTVLRNEILGSVQMRVMLTGMPELRLGLNDKVLFENTGSEYNNGDHVCSLVSMRLESKLIKELKVRMMFK